MYGTNIFEFDPHRDGPGARRPRSVEVPIEYGMVLEDISSGWVGAVTRVEKSGGVHLVELEDRRGRKRSFLLGGGFWLEGKPIIALPPKAAPAQKAPALTTAGGRALTNSGSIAPEKRVGKSLRFLDPRRPSVQESWLITWSRAPRNRALPRPFRPVGKTRCWSSGTPSLTFGKL